MKKIMQYSRKKFEKLDNEKKIRTINMFIEAVYNCWDESEERERMLSELDNCLSYLQDSSGSEMRDITRLLGDLQHGSRDTFLQATAHFLARYGRDYRDQDLLPVAGKQERTVRQVPLYAILHNLRSAFNVGSIIRTSECLGIRKIFMTGYSPTPSNSKVRKTAMSTESRILWEKREDIFLVMNELKESEGVEVIALETTPEACPLHRAKIEKPAVLIVGNEAFGLSEEVLIRADKILEISLSGWKESLNVGVAYGMACYEILRQWNLLDNGKED